MRTIICKKCGAPIDASLGECPICGAVYYILPRDEESDDQTRVWDEDAEKIRAAIEKDETDMDQLEAEPTRVIPVPTPEAAAASDEHRQSIPAPAPAGAKGPTARHPYPRGGKKPPSRTWMFVVMAVALLAVLTVVLCFMTGVFNFGASNQTMPDVVGLNRDVAVNQLKALDISPNIIYEESTEPEGKVIRQSPEEGKTVGKHTGVTLTVSSGAGETPAPGADYVEVPEVMGLSWADAVSRLQASGLTAIKGGEEYSETAPADTVTRQSPLSGARVEPGSSVTLTVSKGPEDKQFSLVITAGKGGLVSPSGTVTVAEGENLTIAVTPDEGYELVELRIDGQSVGAVTEYTIRSVTDDHSVYAVFAAVESPSPSPEAPEQSPVIPIGPSTPTDIPQEP